MINCILETFFNKNVARLWVLAGFQLRHLLFVFVELNLWELEFLYQTNFSVKIHLV